MISTVELEQIWTRAEVAFVQKLAELDPSWGTTTLPLADGFVVLGGPGLFVNRALALGLERKVTSSDIQQLEERCQLVGVPAVVEVTEATDPDLEGLLSERGYRQVDQRSALILALDDGPEPATGADEERRPAADSPDGPVFEAVVDVAGLDLWQRTAAEALGIADAERRRASDLFGRTAMSVDDPGLLIARSPTDNRPLGCATLKIDGAVATLGGMSTLPSERRQGVQGALIHHRLGLARERGCRVAVTMAETGSVSERNLPRHGFTFVHHKTAFERDIGQ